MMFITMKQHSKWRGGGHKILAQSDTRLSLGFSMMCITHTHTQEAEQQFHMLHFSFTKLNTVQSVSLCCYSMERRSKLALLIWGLSEWRASTWPNRIPCGQHLTVTNWFKASFSFAFPGYLEPMFFSTRRYISICSYRNGLYVYYGCSGISPRKSHY